MSPKVSVLMPIYKTEESYLRTTIESILSQTFTDFEFLILDDCPLDDRAALVKSYKDPRIVYLKNTSNMGITPARNKLIDLAKGEYLAVMDHDDISLPKRFEKQVAYLDAHPEVGVVGCLAETFPNHLNLYHPETDAEIRKALTYTCAILHPASMIRKSVLLENNIRYEERFSPAEDYCLWLRLMDYTAFHNIQEVLFKYRYHEHNTTNRQLYDMFYTGEELRYIVRQKHPELWQKKHIWHFSLFDKFYFNHPHIQKPKAKRCQVSVIVPVYNKEPFLRKCLDSITLQTEKDLEIICVNDGSTDDSLSVLQEYAAKDRRIKIITQRNQGLSCARNNGLKNASGEYVSFIDADDWIDPNYYEILLKSAHSMRADIVVAKMTEVSDVLPVQTGNTNFMAFELTDMLSKLKNGSVCDKLFKRTLFTKHRITFPKGRYYEDNIVLLKLLFFADTICWNVKTAYYYYINTSGICRSPKGLRKKNKDRLYIAQLMMRFAKRRHFSQKEKEELRSFLIRTIAYDIASNTKMQKILEIKALAKGK